MDEKDRCVSGGESVGEIRRDVADAMDEVFTEDAELFDRLADASAEDARLSEERLAEMLGCVARRHTTPRSANALTILEPSG